ncbi:MAG: DJ-1/PfpI family protein [Cytophagales bacterium]|jgi:transcriptional regulator GlxA family with amidase domain|nr:DJ-1/PfpI family protein [Cytophagales bacterium]
MKLAFFCLFVCLLYATACNRSDQTEQKHSHAAMMKKMDEPKVSIQTVGILLYDGYNTLDAVGPYQVLSELMGTRVFFVAKQKGLVRNQGGVQIQVDTSMAEVKHLDMLVIPGGFKETYLMTKDTSVLNWIRRIDRTSTYTASVCTGAWVLGATGLLQGKKATTHWYRAKEMLEKYGADFEPKRWVRDGKYWTSAGVTAGMDMSLAVVREVRGEPYLKAAMLDLEYDPQPPVVGGSVANTDPETVEMMRQMYDFGLRDVMPAEQKQK